MSGIPTAFRSPAISNSNYSWCITSNGEIGWEGWDSIAVKDSYGRRSPYTTELSVYISKSDGNIYADIDVYIKSSYGNLDLRIVILSVSTIMFIM